MNKKVKWLLFFLAATICNALLILILFIGLSYLFQVVLGAAESENPQVVSLAYTVTLFGSIIGSFTIYHFTLKWATKKWNLDKHLGRTRFGRKLED